MATIVFPSVTFLSFPSFSIEPMSNMKDEMISFECLKIDVYLFREKKHKSESSKLLV